MRFNSGFKGLIFTSVLELGNEDDSWGPESEKVKSGWKKMPNEELGEVYSSLDTVTVIGENRIS